MRRGTASGLAVPGKTPWEVRYARRLFVTDFLVIVWATVGAQIARFGLVDSSVVIDSPRAAANLEVSYSALTVLLVVAWMSTLTIFGTREARVVGTGWAEYGRIFDASLRLFGILAIFAFLLKVEIARSYVLIAFPVGLIALLIGRWMWRQWLMAKRSRGEFVATVVLVGSIDSVIAIARDLDRLPSAGYRVVAACIPGSDLVRLPGTTISVSADFDDVIALMDRTAADTVVVTSSDLSPQRVRELSWALEPGRQHLVVAPSITDVGGPRVHVRPVAGLPLVHVETPRYDGLKRFSKRAFDLIATVGILALASVPMIFIAVAIRLSTPGVVLFRQERIGYRGSRFMMLKFRSMVVDAEDRLEELASLDRAEGNVVLFKLRSDPRVTPVGAFLRKFSLDELPQLFNVLGGSMSLVGPRPPLEREVAVYEHHVHRRFLVKPGITGLWQVSGRSNLSWEDSVRLDLYYVENWSLTGDFVILWRTLKAVVGRDGAY